MAAIPICETPNLGYVDVDSRTLGLYKLAFRHLCSVPWWDVPGKDAKMSQHPQRSKAAAHAGK